MKKITLLVIVLILLTPISSAEFFKTANVKISPKQIDRRTATLTAVPVQIQILLLQDIPEKKAEIISNTIQCQSEDLYDYYIIKETTTTPIITARLMPDIEKNHTQIKCTMNIKANYDGKIITEQKQIQKTIPLYKNELGTIEQNMQEKINKLNEDIHDFDKKIQHIQRTSKFLGQIAAFAESYSQLDLITANVIGALWSTSTILEKFKNYYTDIAATILWTGIGSLLHKSTTELNQITWNIGYIPTGYISALGTFFKTLTMIQSCQLCDYSNTYTALIEQSAGKKVFTIDSKQGKPTTIEQFTIYEWKPYKSIHVAQLCQCLPAISYNLQKEKQIKCIYRNCIEQNAELGTPFTECDKTLKQQQCLYVDSAAWKISGGNAQAQIFSIITNAVLKQLPVMAMGAAWQAMCDPEIGMLAKEAYPEQYQKPPNIMSDWEVPMCALTAALQMIEETGFFQGNKYEWDRYVGNLEGEDFC